MYFAIPHPKTGEQVYPPQKKAWAFGIEVMPHMLEDNRLYWGPKQRNKYPVVKRFRSEDEQPSGRRLITLISTDGKTPDQVADELSNNLQKYETAKQKALAGLSKHKPTARKADPYQLAREFYDKGNESLASDPEQAFAYYRAVRWNILTADVYTDSLEMGEDGKAFADEMQGILKYSVFHMLHIVSGAGPDGSLLPLLVYLAQDIDNYVSFYPNHRGKPKWNNHKEKERFTQFTRECLNYTLFKANHVCMNLPDKRQSLAIFKVYNDALLEYFSRLSLVEQSKELDRINNQGADRWEEYMKCETEASETNSCDDPTALLSIFSGHLTKALSPIKVDRQSMYDSLIKFNDSQFWGNVEYLLNGVAWETNTVTSSPEG
jgi:hypothetical protein